MTGDEDPFDVPEQAIGAFERLTRLRVTVHDLGGGLWPFLGANRLQHTQPLCAAVKAGPRAPACIDFEINRLRNEIAQTPGGRVHVCHAGLVEWVVPIIRAGRLECVLFAGQRTPGPALVQITRDRMPMSRAPLWKKSARLPDPVNDEDAQPILEALRQLAARLEAWLAASTHQAYPVNPGADPVARRTLIRDFIRNRHHDPIRLSDLAQSLHLSEGRCGHLVKELCSESFIGLVTEARVRTAAAWLRHTDLPVAVIALRSGWGDLSRFHRAFRHRMGVTPHRYRRQGETVPNSSLGVTWEV